MRWWVLGAPALFAGCPKASGRVPELTWDELFVPARYDYVELTAPAGLPPQRATVTEEWTETPEIPLPEGFTGKVWAADDAIGNEPPSRTYFVVGEQGVAYFSSEDGKGRRTYTPKVLLPPRLDGKTRWEGEHGEGASNNRRSCHVEVTPFCEEGAAITCDTHWTGRSTWMRQHYCKGIGWVGYEAVTITGGVATLLWSEEATRDGELLPTVGLERRPFPQIEVHAAKR